MDTIYDITLAIYHNSTLYAYFKLVCYHQAYITVQMPTKNFEPQKPKLTYLSVTGKANCYIQRQSTPIRINFHLLVCALKIDITLAIYHNSTLYAYFKLVCYHQAYITVQMPTKNFEPREKPKLTYLSVTGKANCYIQRQSTPIRINFHLLVCALKIQKLHSRLET